MHINFLTAITESELQQRGIELQQRGCRVLLDRVRMLRLLKSGGVSTLEACASLLGYSPRQVLRWWDCYKQGGLTALLATSTPGMKSRLSAEAWAALEHAQRTGQVRTLEEARVFLYENWGIYYQSVNGIWRQVQRRSTGTGQASKRRPPPHMTRYQVEATATAVHFRNKSNPASRVPR